jgi:hypothetical protein
MDDAARSLPGIKPIADLVYNQWVRLFLGVTTLANISSSEMGITTNAWNIVYDPTADKVIIWTNNRVNLSTKRTPTVYIPKRTARPAKVPSPGIHPPTTNLRQMTRQQLHCDQYISVEQSTNWSATLPQHRTTPVTTITWNATANQLMQPQEIPKPKQVIKSHLPKAQSRHHKRTLGNRKDQCWKRTLPTSNNAPYSKDSQPRNRKWQNQARQFILNWTPQQMDAYLAIPEVAMKWNVEPG